MKTRFDRGNDKKGGIGARPTVWGMGENWGPSRCRKPCRRGGGGKEGSKKRKVSPLDKSAGGSLFAARGQKQKKGGNRVHQRVKKRFMITKVT